MTFEEKIEFAEKFTVKIKELAEQEHKAHLTLERFGQMTDDEIIYEKRSAEVVDLLCDYIYGLSWELAALTDLQKENAERLKRIELKLSEK